MYAFFYIRKVRFAAGFNFKMFGVALMFHFDYPRGVNFNVGPFFAKIEKL